MCRRLRSVLPEPVKPIWKAGSKNGKSNMGVIKSVG